MKIHWTGMSKDKAVTGDGDPLMKASVRTRPWPVNGSPCGNNARKLNHDETWYTNDVHDNMMILYVAPNQVTFPFQSCHSHFCQIAGVQSFSNVSRLFRHPTKEYYLPCIAGTCTETRGRLRNTWDTSISYNHRIEWTWDSQSLSDAIDIELLRALMPWSSCEARLSNLESSSGGP